MALHENLIRVVRYFLAGGASVLIDLSLFGVLAYFVLPVSGFFSHPEVMFFLANGVGLVAGFLLGFCLQRNWVFRSQGAVRLQFLSMVLLLLVNTVWSGLLINALHAASIPLIAAKIAVIICMTVSNYLIYRFVIFRLV